MTPNHEALRDAEKEAYKRCFEVMTGNLIIGMSDETAKEEFQACCGNVYRASVIAGLNPKGV